MKSFLKKLVLAMLSFMARVRLKRLNPFVIGVTGSVGKTSAKEAIYTILSARYNVYRSNKNYNTEFGMPLAILEQKSGFSSPFKWIKVMLGAFWKTFFARGKIRILILEMGTDKPGDMTDLLKIVTPQVGVMTSIKPVHLDKGQFKDMDDIFNEKKKLVEALPEKAFAVLNADDPFINSLRGKLTCKTIFYGFAEWADLRALDVKNTSEGLAFTVVYKDQVAIGRARVLGIFHIHVLLAAIAVALTQGFTLQDAVAALAKFKLPPGRMNPIAGINESLIIDSSYNASPESVKVALDTLKDFSGRRIAVLGNMNELGEYSEQLHRAVGKYARGRADLLITIGENAKWIADEAISNGFPQKDVLSFLDAAAAADVLKKKILKGDVLLIKGSQNNARLEKLVKALMKEPWQAARLLARQEREWEKR